MPTKTEAKTTVKRAKPYIDDVPAGVEDGENDPKHAITAPAPGATDRKKEPLPPEIKSRPRKLLTPEELIAEEQRLIQKYDQIVPNTLRNATKGQPIEDFTQDEIAKYNHKRSVTINCANADCSNTRRIATSDLAQVRYCEDCTRVNRNTRKRKRRAATKSE